MSHGEAYSLVQGVTIVVDAPFTVAMIAPQRRRRVTRRRWLEPQAAASSRCSMPCYSATSSSHLEHNSGSETLPSWIALAFRRQ